MRISPKIPRLDVTEESATQDKKLFRLDQVARKVFWVLAGLSLVTTVAAFTAFMILVWPLALTAALISATFACAMGLALAYQPAMPHLPKFIQKVAQVIHASSMELFAFMVTSMTYLVNLAKKNKPLQQGDQPILLVHGYLHNSSAWLYFKKRLEQEGMGPVWTINLGKPLQSVEEHAKKVKKCLEEMQVQTGQPIRVIGHSMGGLVSAWAINNMQEGSVSQLITLGSPLDGTYLGNMGFGHSADDMCYQSPFIKDLAQKISNLHVSRFHFASDQDLLVFPRTSALFSNDSDYKDENRYRFADIGHISFLYSDKVIDQTIEILHRNDF